MSGSDRTFAQSLVKGAAADQVTRFLEMAGHCPDTWRVLERPLRGEIQTFQHRQIAAAYSRILGAPEDRVARRQEFLLRTAVTSILFPLEELEDRLLVHLEQRGLPALFHHVVRELCDQTDQTADVFAAADACRAAVFRIEDTMREVGDAPDGPERLLASLVESLSHLQHVLADVDVPFGWTGVALLWVTASFGLGALPDDPTATEHFATEA
ncbi:MAG: hypothetical protein KC656_22450 [Myxococcales bacterium]|nr:hypothetical protein [Myxococcales bacterium]MCB9671524.1 hypothetical protein [Alphaproteobacteria bacterium]MCB9691886.1 hypothetical protein [Alphaproteobacteria bacterium]